MGQEKHNKVAIITYRAHPESTTNVRLLMDVALTLKRSGWDVEIHAQKPKGFNQKELLPNVEGIRIIRHKVLVYETSGIWQRAVNGFALGAQVFLTTLFSKKNSLLIADTTSPFLGLVAWGMNTLRGTPYLYLAMEIMPEAGIVLGKIRAGGLVDRAWRFANGRVIGRAATVITLGEQMKKTLSVYTHNDRIAIIPTWAKSGIKPIPKESNPFIKKHKMEGSVVIAYSGNMGLSHELNTIVEAAYKLQDVPHVKFLFIGKGVQKGVLVNMVSAKRLKNAILLPWQSEDMLPYSLAAGDFAVVSLQPGLAGSVFPSRTYSAMAAGQAVIAIMDADHEIAQMVEREKIGLSVQPGESDDLAGKIAEIASMPEAIANMKKSAHLLARNRFAMLKSTMRYEQIAKQASMLEKS